MASQKHILVVEDEATSRATLSAYFENEGYRVTGVENGDEMRAAFADGSVDLVMLDIRLPGEDGLSLLNALRSRSDVGVIMVSGRSDDVDRIVALEMGADDYVTKPFNPRELLARAKNLLRRTDAAHQNGNGASARSFSGWSLDLERRRLTAPDGKNVKLTRGEFELLAALADRPGRVLSRDSLLDQISSREWAPNDRTIDVLIGRLRRKIEADPKDPAHIVTVHGVGYVFAGHPD